MQDVCSFNNNTNNPVNKYTCLDEYSLSQIIIQYCKKHPESKNQMIKYYVRKEDTNIERYINQVILIALNQIVQYENQHGNTHCEISYKDCMQHLCFYDDLDYETQIIINKAFLSTGTSKSNEWVSNMQINNVMNQYSLAYPEYLFLGAVPADIVDLSKSYFNFFNMQDIQSIFKDKAYKYYGVIFNNSKYGQQGTHWVSLFIDTVNKVFYFSDSGGSKPHKNVQQTIQALQTQFFSGYTLKYNMSKHQRDESECGIYSMYFQFIMNEGIKESQFEKYRKLKNLDYDKMQSLRKIIFINPESDLLMNILKRVKNITEYLKDTYEEKQISMYDLSQYLDKHKDTYSKPVIAKPILHDLSVISNKQNNGEQIYFELTNNKWNKNDKNIVRDYIKKKLSKYDKFDYIPQDDDVQQIHVKLKQLYKKRLIHSNTIKSQ